MTQSLPKLYTFDEFVEFLQTQNENIYYELYDGDIIKMPLPTGEHEEIVGFLIKFLLAECLRLNLNYFVPSKTLVRPETKQSGYFPDVLLLNSSNLINEPLWKKESIITQPESIALVIEVVSTNWRDDYHKKLADYDEMGIKEYWIVEDTALDGFPGLKQVSVDYGAFANKSLIGQDKQPTITIYSFNDEGEYQGKQFRGSDRIESSTFPELNLTAQQIFSASY